MLEQFNPCDDAAPGGIRITQETRYGRIVHCIEDNHLFSEKVPRDELAVVVHPIPCHTDGCRIHQDIALHIAQLFVGYCSAAELAGQRLRPPGSAPHDSGVRAVRESGVARESLFIASKVKPEHLRYDDVLKSCEGSLRRLGMDYLDLYLIHWPGGNMRLTYTFRALNELVTDGKVRHLGVSNFDLRLLKASEEASDTPLVTNQVPYSVSDRTYARNGVLDYCRERHIVLTAYSPMDQGHFRPNKAVRAVAVAHSATPHQIALAWLVAQPLVITIPMSLDPEHQSQNLAAIDIKLTEDEMAQLA